MHCTFHPPDDQDPCVQDHSTDVTGPLLPITHPKCMRQLQRLGLRLLLAGNIESGQRLSDVRLQLLPL